MTNGRNFTQEYCNLNYNIQVKHVQLFSYMYYIYRSAANITLCHDGMYCSTYKIISIIKSNMNHHWTNKNLNFCYQTDHTAISNNLKIITCIIFVRNTSSFKYSKVETNLHFKYC